MTTLHALPDDLILHANEDTGRSTSAMSMLFDYYLTDPAGSYLTDPAGNRLVGYQAQSVYPQILHALPDDFILHAEATNG